MHKRARFTKKGVKKTVRRMGFVVKNETYDRSGYYIVGTYKGQEIHCAGVDEFEAYEHLLRYMEDEDEVSKS